MKPSPEPKLGQVIESPNGLGKAQVVALTPDDVIIKISTWDGDAFTLHIPRDHWAEYTRGATITDP